MNTKIDLVTQIEPQKLHIWQEQGEHFKVNIVGSSDKASQGDIFIQRLDKSARLRRALKIGAIFWGIGIFCILIPVLHFVLVPAFMLLGPVVGYVIYQTEGMVLGGVGICPNCSEKLPIEKSKEEWPLSDLCTHCHSAVKINLLSE